MAFEDAEHLQEEPTSRWRMSLTLPVLLVIGLLLYELTAQPALGVAALCVKFGWEDFRTAFWLRGIDPDRRRGRACMWLYLASGMWTTAITASVMIFAFAFFKGLQGRAAGQVNGPPPQVMGALLTAFAGYLLSSLATAIALGLGLWYGVKLWLDSSTHRSRRWNVWPPPDLPSLTNKANRLIVTALIVVVLPLMLVGMFLVIAAFAPPPGNGGAQPPGGLLIGVMCIVMLVLIGGPVVILVMRDVLTRRVMARSPSECWGTEPLPAENL